MLLVAPIASHARHVFIGAFAEGRNSAGSFPGLDQVFALGEGRPTPLGKSARFGQVHPGEATKVHFLERTTEPEQEDPALGPALVDHEVKAAAVGVAAGLFDRRHRPRTQPIEPSGHFPTPQHLPQRATRIVAYVHVHRQTVRGELSPEFMAFVDGPGHRRTSVRRTPHPPLRGTFSPLRGEKGEKGRLAIRSAEQIGRSSSRKIGGRTSITRSWTHRVVDRRHRNRLGARILYHRICSSRAPSNIVASAPLQQPPDDHP
jgi:hypothetical protein